MIAGTDYAFEANHLLAVKDLVLHCILQGRRSQESRPNIRCEHDKPSEGGNKLGRTSSTDIIVEDRPGFRFNDDKLLSVVIPEVFEFYRRCGVHRE